MNAKLISLLCAPLAPLTLLYCGLRREWGCKASKFSVLLHTALFASLHIPVVMLTSVERKVREGSWLDKLVSPLARHVFASYIILALVVTCRSMCASFRGESA